MMHSLSCHSSDCPCVFLASRGPSSHHQIRAGRVLAGRLAASPRTDRSAARACTTPPSPHRRTLRSVPEDGAGVAGPAGRPARPLPFGAALEVVPTARNRRVLPRSPALHREITPPPFVPWGAGASQHTPTSASATDNACRLARSESSCVHLHNTNVCVTLAKLAAARSVARSVGECGGLCVGEWAGGEANRLSCSLCCAPITPECRQVAIWVCLLVFSMPSCFGYLPCKLSSSERFLGPTWHVGTHPPGSARTECSGAVRRNGRRKGGWNSTLDCSVLASCRCRRPTR